MQASIEVLEVHATDTKPLFKEPHVPAEEDRFAKELAELGMSRGSKTVDESFRKYIHEGFVRKSFAETTYTQKDFYGGSSRVFGGIEPVDDHTVDVNVMKRKGSTSVGKAFIPDHWLEEDTPVKGRTSAKEKLLITRNDYNRHPHFRQADSGVNKKLKFHTPSPNGTQSRSKVHQSGKKVNVESAESIGKRYRKTGGITPKVKNLTHQLMLMITNNMTLILHAYNNQRLTSMQGKETNLGEMSFNHKNARVCSYLFQQSANNNLMNETLVLSMGLTATRAELQCLLPLAPINEVVRTRNNLNLKLINNDEIN